MSDTTDEAPFAEPGDVVGRWRALTDSEAEIAPTLLDDASDMVRDEWPDIDDRIAAGTIPAGRVKRIVANMVKRALIALDADGVEQETETAGPFSLGRTYSNPSGNLYFLAAERVTLSGRRVRRGRAFVVDLAPSAGLPPSDGLMYRDC